jgi:predicted TIM-barrel fold metal-dependent hydrolase
MDRGLIDRRHALCCGAAAVGGLFTSLTDAAASDAAPPREVPALARRLIDATFHGLDATRLWDVHTHLLGTGDAGSGCTVHPQLDSWWHPMEAARKRVILHGAGVEQGSRSVDLDYVRRLATLAADFPSGARWMLFAFDRAHDDQGASDPARTTFHVPDAWAALVARTQSDRFGWVASIHPYRDDAPARLRYALAQGALAVKWLPSAMNIDLRDPRCVPLYNALAAARVPLIVHAGEEKAVPGAQRDDLGNPLLVRAALRHGVRVIVAHCASLGHALDLDQRAPRESPAFELFARMMDEREWQGLLLGDVSALFLANRDPAVWRTVLAREDWHARLLHGSDYPLPCVAPLVRLAPLVRAGVLDPNDVPALEALRQHNPLLFDLALKRRVAWCGAGLSVTVFHTRDLVVGGRHG